MNILFNMKGVLKVFLFYFKLERMFVMLYNKDWVRNISFLVMNKVKFFVLK